MDGMAGILNISIHKRSVVRNISYTKIKIGNSNGYIKCIDSNEYNFNNIFNKSNDVCVIALYDNKEFNVDIVYDKQYYKFTTNSETYTDDIFVHLINADAVYNFELTCCNAQIINPIITIFGMDLKYVKHNINLDNTVTYYFDLENNPTNCLWINCIKNCIIKKKQNFKISGLCDGAYFLTYTRIYCERCSRRILMHSEKDIIKFNTSQYNNNITDCISELNTYIA
jgi:hypothetical protein